MKFRPLDPWIKGNNSINPNNFYGQLEPCLAPINYIGKKNEYVDDEELVY